VLVQDPAESQHVLAVESETAMSSEVLVVPLTRIGRYAFSSVFRESAFQTFESDHSRNSFGGREQESGA